MNKRTERLVETLLVLSVPIALLACAETADVKTKSNAALTEMQSESNTQLKQLTLLEKSSGEHQSLALDVPLTETIEPGQEADSTAATNSGLEDASNDTDTTLADSSNAAPEKHIVYFASDISDVKNEDYDLIKQHADFLLQHPDVVATINGHADIQGSENYNLKLSSKRADAVLYLLTQFGVPESQLITASYGESVPATTIDDWDANRRVELEYKNAMTVGTR